MSRKRRDIGEKEKEKNFLKRKMRDFQGFLTFSCDFSRSRKFHAAIFRGTLHQVPFLMFDAERAREIIVRSNDVRKLIKTLTT